MLETHRKHFQSYKCNQIIGAMDPGFTFGRRGVKYPDLAQRVSRCNDTLTRDLYSQVQSLIRCNRDAEILLYRFYNASTHKEREKIASLYYFNCIEPANEDYSDICTSYEYYTQESPVDNPWVKNTLDIIRDETEYLYGILKEEWDKRLSHV